MSSPWYKSESKGLGYLIDRLKVMLGLYTDMPGPQYVVDLDRSRKCTKPQITSRFRSVGYRLEEMVC